MERSIGDKFEVEDGKILQVVEAIGCDKYNYNDVNCFSTLIRGFCSPKMREDCKSVPISHCKRITMSQEDKIKFMQMALGTMGVSLEERKLDYIVSIYDLISIKGGETDLMDICKTKLEVDKRHQIKIPKVKSSDLA